MNGLQVRKLGKIKFEECKTFKNEKLSGNKIAEYRLLLAVKH